MAVQLLIRDGTPDWWASPDIWVVPGTDPSGPAGTPVAGQTAYLWATVTNQGDLDVAQAQVDFWVANPSMQIRKSTSNHIGTAFVDVSAGASQDALCLVPWNVTLINGGHECVVVEASSPADPLSPPPADPDVLDAPTYRQIAQRNLSVAAMSGQARREIMLSINAGIRADRNVDVKVEVGGELPANILKSLGLNANRNSGAKRIEAGLSGHSSCGSSSIAREKRMNVRVARGTAVPVFLSIESSGHLAPEEYALVRVVESERDRVLGGLSVVVIEGEQRKGGGK